MLHYCLILITCYSCLGGIDPLGSIFVDQIASRNLSLSSRFSSLLKYVFKVFPNDSLDFIGICCGISFVPNFINLNLCSPFG
jgi:hypothetical protein